MAKLGSYYGLCPLIDHRSLLGICKDEADGVVVVTLGRNIAIKFKLSDQKQLCSWRTKDKFSSPIIYDKQQLQYAAVFNDSFIRTWNGDEEFLDKLKKLKFTQQIQTLFLCNDKSFVVFKNGAISPLKAAIENRKQLNLKKILNTETDYIEDVLHKFFNGTAYVGLVVNSNGNYCLYWTKFNEINEQDRVYKIPLVRDLAKIKGYVFHVDKTSVNFLSLWSDGRIYLSDLVEDSTHIGELFTVMESISCREYVSMISLDHNYIAMYGCNSNEEGASLIVYNIQFKVVQARLSFKLFTNGAKQWCIDHNLFCPVGQNLAVVPFHLDTEQLAALVGSHKVIECSSDPDISIVHKVQFANWQSDKDYPENIKLTELEEKISDLLTQGVSKNLIFETHLENCLKQGTIDELVHVLNYFTDISELGLIKAIKLILNLDPKLFINFTTNALKYFPEKLQPTERADLLDIVLTKSFNQSLLLSHLRSVLNLDEVLIFLEYINFLMSDDGHCLPSLNSTETDAKLIQWCCILLDSNYQKFLLTKDDKIKDILSSLKELVGQDLCASNDLMCTASLLHEIKNGKSVHKNIPMVGLNYSIEELNLY